VIEDHLHPFLSLYQKAPQPLRSLVGLVYRMLPQRLRHGPVYPEFQKLLRDLRAWTPQQVADYQLAQLRASLLAAAKTPYYAGRFSALGLQPKTLDSLDQFSAYPLLTKLELQTHREKMVNRDLPAHQRLYMTTGGSTGQPVGFYLHKGVSRAKELAFQEHQWSHYGYRPGARVAIIRGATMSGISSYDSIRGWLTLSSHQLTAERIPQYVAELERFRPNHIHAYPSSLILLARGMRQLGLKLSFKPASLFCGSERLSAEDHDLLSQFFGCPICHWYGHSERAVLASSHPGTQSLQPNPLYGYFEFSPPDEDGLCEIIGTTFHNHVMPLIRYETGDRARIEPGPRGPIITAIEGRSQEFLISRIGRSVPLTAINMHDRAFDGLLALQFLQVSSGQVELHYLPGPTWHSSREPSVQSAVSEKLGSDFQLTLHQKDSLSKTASGKHRWLVTPQSKTS
jgi:phenylacetate-CoA ligase